MFPSYHSKLFTIFNQLHTIGNIRGSFKHRLFTQTAEHDRVFPHCHEGNSAVQQRQLLGAIQNPQRRQTRLRPCSNGLWYFLCPVAKTCLRQNNRRNLFSYPISWQAIQPRPSQGQDKGPQGSHQ